MFIKTTLTLFDSYKDFLTEFQVSFEWNSQVFQVYSPSFVTSLTQRLVMKIKQLTKLKNKANLNQSHL